MKACASVYDDTGPGVPGTTGTPTRIADHGKPSQSPPSRTREKFQMQIKQIKHIDKDFFLKKEKEKFNHTQLASLCLVAQLVNNLR